MAKQQQLKRPRDYAHDTIQNMLRYIELNVPPPYQEQTKEHIRATMALNLARNTKK